MLDAAARRIIDPPLNRGGRWMARRGVPADLVTLSGLVLGLVGAGLIAVGHPLIALGFVWLSRVADGLDGAVARASQKTDFGGFLDITSDFLFYGAVPLGFVLWNPTENGAAGAFLLTAFYFNGASFLGYAILAEKRGIETSAQGSKSLYYSNGLLEGTETILFFTLLCLIPTGFSAMSWVFGGLCFLTAILRLIGAHKQFRN